jgi:tetratricopeptide (TPR) repeat protein
MAIKKLTIFIFGIFYIINVNAQTQSELETAFSKSYVLEKNKEYEDAISILKTVYNKSSYEVNLRLGWLSYLAGNNKSSISYYSLAEGICPKATEPKWGIINPLAKMEDWVAVEKEYVGILKLDPKNSIANYRLGLIYYYRKNYLTARKYLDITLELNPFDYDALLTSAWNNYFLGKTNEAKIQFQKVLLYNPKDSFALEGLGLIK